MALRSAVRLHALLEPLHLQIDATSACRVSGSLMASTSPRCGLTSSASAHAPPPTHAPADWTTATRAQFSLQPSYFSPLYAAHATAVGADTRRRLAAKLLRAHYELSQEVPGYDAAQHEATQVHRAREMERLADELRALSKRTSLARCPSMESALGWYSLLEDATAGGAHGDEAEAFHAVAAGRESVWKHWKEHFVDKYAATPSLVPLHEVYARHPVQPDAAGGILEGEGGAPAKAAPGKPPTAGMRGKPSWASPGVARAVGMRKTSVADVRVAPGTGRIFINEKPFDAFLPDVSVRMHVIQPMLVTGTLGRYDVIARVHGGGPSSMAQAVQHGLAKALTLQLGGNSRRDCAPPAVVKLNQMVLHDSRRVERKKPGRKAARTGFTYRRR